MQVHLYDGIYGELYGLVHIKHLLGLQILTGSLASLPANTKLESRSGEHRGSGSPLVKMTQEAPYKWLSAILFTTLPILILLTFRDYGISWDEQLQDTYGEYVVRYYTSFFRDTSAVGFGDLHYYGGFFEALL